MSFSGSSGGGVPGFTLKKFESQGEVEEKKQKRQEEWEKVRKPDDPEECPEAPIDNRCLYDKLQEQKLKKDEEFEEKVAFRNQVRRLDADETSFLDFCTERQHEINQERKQEEETVISELKDAKVIKMTESKPEEKKSRPIQQQQSKRSQMSLLAGAVKRKGSEETSPCKKLRTESTEGDTQTEKAQKTEGNTAASDENSGKSSQLARVIGVLPRALPGLTEYDDSSDSVSSSSDSEADFSLSGKNSIVVIRQQIQQQR
ncbi:PSME3-interacting protein-like [Mercenaria mercenaria]|uniref:PSME3-interacting protein-like n=1 Tax=Mercenaria mercenaria TaxID=6596 RepID=UPI001E1D8B01|nr:PSME3-interacting protein-like [Mercenaria mercenaria]